MSEAEFERMVAYLERYVGRYGLQPVWDQLLREGHDPALINRAIAEYDRRLTEGPAPIASSQSSQEIAKEAARPALSFDPPPPPQGSLAARLFALAGGMVLGTLIVALFLVALIVLALGGVCYYIAYHSQGHH